MTDKINDKKINLYTPEKRQQTVTKKRISLWMFVWWTTFAVVLMVMLGFMVFYFLPALKTEFNLQIARRHSSNVQMKEFTSTSDQVKCKFNDSGIKFKNLKIIEPQTRNKRKIVLPVKPEKRKSPQPTISIDQETRYQTEGEESHQSDNIITLPYYDLQNDNIITQPYSESLPSTPEIDVDYSQPPVLLPYIQSPPPTTTKTFPSMDQQADKLILQSSQNSLPFRLANALPQVHFDYPHDLQELKNSDTAGNDNPFEAVAQRFSLKGLRIEYTPSTDIAQSIANHISAKYHAPPLVFVTNRDSAFDFTYADLTLHDKRNNKYFYKAVAVWSEFDDMRFRGQFETEWTACSAYQGTPWKSTWNPPFVHYAAYSLYSKNDLWISEDEMRQYIQSYRQTIQ